jgi:hypothetical protein
LALLNLVVTGGFVVAASAGAGGAA